MGGLRDRGAQWRTALGFGTLPAGVTLQKSFYVFNTGGLGGCRSVSGTGRVLKQLWEVRAL